MKKPRSALEAAIRTHPSYSTAHENLGDIYAKMASQAYGKALQLDNRNAAAQTKLAMIKDLFATRSARNPNRSQLLQHLPSRVSRGQESSEKISGKTAEKAAVKAEQAEKPVSEKTAIGTAVAEKPSPEKQAASGDSSEIIKTVNAWAKAWSDKDVTAYLAFYATDFRAPGGVSRASWEKARRERIPKPKSIHVAVVNPRINVIDDTHARVTFKQSYHSDAIKSNTLKTLELVKTGDTWLINQENVGR